MYFSPDICKYLYPNLTRKKIMKCDTVYRKACMLQSFNGPLESMELRGRGFKDERDYLALILEQERAWEIEHLWCDIDQAGQKKE